MAASSYKKDVVHTTVISYKCGSIALSQYHYGHFYLSHAHNFIATIHPNGAFSVSLPNGLLNVSHNGRKAYKPKKEIICVSQNNREIFDPVWFKSP